MKLLSRDFSPTHFSLSSASSSVVSRSHVSPLFLFQSLSRDHPLQAFHHLPKVFYFSHQPLLIRTSLALEHSAPLHLGPGDGAPRGVELYHSATVATYQIPVGHMCLGHSFPSRRHRFDQSSCSCVALQKAVFFTCGNVLNFL